MNGFLSEIYTQFIFQKYLIKSLRNLNLYSILNQFWEKRNKGKIIETKRR